MPTNPFKKIEDALSGTTTTTTPRTTPRRKTPRRRTPGSRGDVKVKAAYRNPKKRKSSRAPSKVSRKYRGKSAAGLRTAAKARQKPARQRAVAQQARNRAARGVSNRVSIGKGAYWK